MKLKRITYCNYQNVGKFLQLVINGRKILVCTYVINAT